MILTRRCWWAGNSVALAVSDCSFSAVSVGFATWVFFALVALSSCAAELAGVASGLLAGFSTLVLVQAGGCNIYAVTCLASRSGAVLLCAVFGLLAFRV